MRGRESAVRFGKPLCQRPLEFARWQTIADVLRIAYYSEGPTTDSGETVQLAQKCKVIKCTNAAPADDVYCSRCREEIDGEPITILQAVRECLL